jgi:myo-inositol-1(or 4)-monophosphatase
MLTLAVTLARMGAEIHRQGRTTLLRVSEKSSPFDLVTQVDREAEAAIVEALASVRPEDAVLGEEGGGREGTSGVRWIIDPLDGTTNYVYRYPAHAVSIGVEIGGTRSVGVVLDTARDLLYTGVRGGTATVNGEPIVASGKDEAATAMVATGFSFDPELRRRQGELLPLLLPRVRDIRRSGAASIDLCAVASGTVDAYYEGGLALWDVAAGAVIAEAAGAAILLGEAKGYPGVSVVVANPTLLAELRTILAEAGFAVEEPAHED